MGLPKPGGFADYALSGLLGLLVFGVPCFLILLHLDVGVAASSLLVLAGIAALLVYISFEHRAHRKDARKHLLLTRAAGRLSSAMTAPSSEPADPEEPSRPADP